MYVIECVSEIKNYIHRKLNIIILLITTLIVYEYFTQWAMISSRFQDQLKSYRCLTIEMSKRRTYVIIIKQFFSLYLTVPKAENENREIFF